MRRFAVVLTLLVLSLLVLSLPARAGWKNLVGEEAPPLGIESWIAAPDGRTLAELKGRVVLLLLGGAAEERVDHWNDLRAAYWEDGLRVVRLLHKAPEDAAALLDGAGIEFSLAVGSHAGYGDGETVRAVLIAANGEVEWEGSPKDVDEGALAGLLRKANDCYLRRVAADLKDAAAAFSKGQLGKARELASAVLLAEGTSDEVIVDADDIVARVKALHAYWQSQAARAKARGDVAEAAVCLERITKRFPDAEEGDAAKTDLDALEAGPGFKNEVLAAEQYAKFRVELARAGDNEKKVAALVKKIEKYLERNAGTRGAERTARLLDSTREDPAVLAIEAFIAGKKIDTRSPDWREKLPKPPQVEFRKGKTYYWNLETNQGSMKLRFLPDEAPMHVSSTIYLSLLGFYDGLTFHRVIPGFMAQGGCPKGTGTGSPGYKYDGEFGGGTKHDRAGILSMANAGSGTDGSQFFITFVPTPNLDGKHTVFGVLVGGEATLKKLEAMGTPGEGRPTGKLVIEKATVTVE